MEPTGWCDPRRRAYGVGSAVDAPPRVRQQPRPDAATGGVLKRSLSEIERWQQALYLRAVKQRTAVPVQPARHQHLDIGAVLAGAVSARAGGFSGPLSSAFAGRSPQPSSTLSSLTTAPRVAPMQQLFQRQVMAAPSVHQEAARRPATATASPATAREMALLQELEKKLLDDEDETAEAAGSACGSAVTNSGWGQTMHELNSIAATPPLPSRPKTGTTNKNYNTAPLTTRSPSDSTSSTTSSTASSSPPTSAASLRQLLSEAAAAIADGNQAAAVAHLAIVKVSANPSGDADQRLVAMMAAALSSRVGPHASSQQHLADLCGGNHRAAWQLLHDISPCFGLALHSANLAILDAAAGHRAIHVVDFDVSVAQHAALIQALGSCRAPGSTCLRVTAVADPTSPFTPALAQALAWTAERLKRHAQQAGVEFRFKEVSCRADEIEASRLGCQPGEEALAVNLAFTLSRVPDESVSPANPRDELLRRVRALGPSVVTLVEQDVNTNTAPLGARFTDACAHYGAVLESLDATLARDSAQRACAEAALAGKARNVVAREGADRVERCEVFGKWRARFGMAGLRPVPIGQGIADSVRARLGPAARPGFDVKLDDGRIRVGWMGRVVTVASAWR
jgi:hypothetical protein